MAQVHGPCHSHGKHGSGSQLLASSLSHLENEPADGSSAYFCIAINYKKSSYLNLRGEEVLIGNFTYSDLTSKNDLPVNYPIIKTTNQNMFAIY